MMVFLAGLSGSKKVVPLIRRSKKKLGALYKRSLLLSFFLLFVRACEGGRTRDDDAAAMEVRAILLPLRSSAPLLLRPGLSSPRRVALFAATAATSSTHARLAGTKRELRHAAAPAPLPEPMHPRKK